MNKKVYIIGAVTGLEREAVVAKFDKAAQALKGAGMVPVNPIDLVPETSTWNEAMRICISRMMLCGAVLLLPDWEESRGATLEVMIARNLEMPQFEQSLKFSKIW